MKEVSTNTQPIRRRYSLAASTAALFASTMLLFPWSQAQAGLPKDIELHDATGVLYDAMAANTSTNITVGPKATVMMGGRQARRDLILWRNFQWQRY